MKKSLPKVGLALGLRMTTQPDTPLSLRMARRGLSAPELARRLGVDRATVWRWMTGRSLPDVVRAQRVAAALGSTVARLWPA